MKALAVVTLSLLGCSAGLGQTSTLDLSAAGTFGNIQASAEVALQDAQDCPPYTPYENGVTYIVFTPSNVSCMSDQYDTLSLICDSAGINQFLPPGTYTATSSYSGYSSLTSSGAACTVSGSSASTAVTVPKGTTAIGAQPNALVLQAGQVLSVPVTLNAETWDPYTDPEVYATGKATLYFGSVALASSALAANGFDQQYNYGIATITLPTTGVPPGRYPLYVQYNGDSNFLPSKTDPFTVTMEAAQMATSCVLTITPNFVVQGETTKFSIQVTPTGTIVPSGTVTLLVNGATLDSVVLTGGAASLTVPVALTSGTYNFQALYGGDTYNLPSTSSSVGLTVNGQAATTTAITLSPSTVSQGATTLLTATVTPQAGNVAPTGSVALYADGDVVTNLPLTNGVDRLTVSTAGLPPGNYIVIGKYGGSATAAPSTSPATTLTVLAAANVSLVASPNPVTHGSITTLTATVEGGNGSPVTSGTVVFSYAGSSLGSMNLTANGTAQLPIETNGFAAGTYTIQAAFSGSGSIPAAAGTVSLIVH